ncbi:hypothetical protein [Povalibacter sp.]|uniref:hypothetical protein n=1 Tax=Povalibacter sp. TaxID=1962978 RepID=UPI002F4082B9
MPTFAEMMQRMLGAQGQGSTAKTVEIFGWLILAEGVLLFLAPEFAASLLRLPTLSEQAANYLRLVGLLVGGLGMLYVVSGRLNAQGFIFASLLDRPLVPPVMAALWLLNLIPWQLALLFAIQDFGSFLWTWSAWKREFEPIKAKI